MHFVNEEQKRWTIFFSFFLFAAALWDRLFAAFRIKLEKRIPLILDLCIIRLTIFFVSGLSPYQVVQNQTAPVILQRTWQYPPPDWIKVKTDGSSNGQPGPSSYAGILINCIGFVQGCFSSVLGMGFAFEAELVGVMMAVDISIREGILSGLNLIQLWCLFFDRDL